MNSLEVGDTRDKTCLRCDMRVNETVEHTLAECPAYEIDRDKLIMEYKGFLGENKFRDLVELEDKRLKPINAERCVFATKLQHLLSERLRLSA